MTLLNQEQNGQPGSNGDGARVATQHPARRDLHRLAPSVLLVAILMLGAALRLQHITQPFTDYAAWRQTSTAMIADNFYRRNSNILYPEVSWSGPGPSYQGREFQTVTYLAAQLYSVFGQHDWVGRAVAVTFGLWGIFALYHLIRRVWDESSALAGAAVMAVLPGGIFIDRSFLPDPAMVALVVTAFWMLLAHLQTGQRRFLGLAVAFGIWGFLSKITGLIVALPMLYAVAHYTAQARQRKQGSPKITELAVAAVVTLAPVVAYYLWARHLSLTYPPYHFAGAGNWLWNDGPRAWLGRSYFLPSLWWNLEGWLWSKPVMLLAMIGFLGSGLRRAQSAHRDTPSAPNTDEPTQHAPAKWLFHWWMLASVIYYLIGAKELVSNSWNFHIVNPPVAALAGAGLVLLARSAGAMTRRFLPARSAATSWAGIAIIVLCLLVILRSGHKRLQAMYVPPPPWNATQSYRMGLALREVSQPGDLVVTIPNDVGEPVAIYYSGRRGWVFPPPWPGVQWSNQWAESDARLIHLFEQLRGQGADWFGVVADQQAELRQRYPRFLAHIERTGQLRRRDESYLIYAIPPSSSKASS